MVAAAAAKWTSGQDSIRVIFYDRCTRMVSARFACGYNASHTDERPRSRTRTSSSSSTSSLWHRFRWMIPSSLSLSPCSLSRLAHKYSFRSFFATPNLWQTTGVSSPLSSHSLLSISLWLSAVVVLLLSFHCYDWQFLTDRGNGGQSACDKVWRKVVFLHFLYDSPFSSASSFAVGLWVVRSVLLGIQRTIDVGERPLLATVSSGSGLRSTVSWNCPFQPSIIEPQLSNSLILSHTRAISSTTLFNREAR